MVFIYTKTQIHIVFSTLMVLAIFFISSPFILAQNSAQNRLILTITPELPGPNEEVTASIRYYLSDLDRAIINWYINGELSASGSGIDSFTFNSGSLGERVTLLVSVTTQDNQNLSRTHSIISGNVDLIWEAKTHTPPTYAGRALPSAGSVLRVLAIPQLKIPGGANIHTQNLFYEWRVNNRLASGASGQGRNIFETNVNPYTQNTAVSVVVTNREQSVAAKKEVVIPTYDPVLLLYEDDALIGPRYERAINDDFVITDTEVSLVAEPYYIDLERVSFPDALTWELNAEQAQANINDSRRITLVKGVGATDGRANLVVKLFNPDTFFEVARRVINIWF